jgi:hypothetical protein
VPASGRPHHLPSPLSRLTPLPLLSARTGLRYGGCTATVQRALPACGTLLGKEGRSRMQRRLVLGLLPVGGVLAGVLGLGVASANHGQPHGKALGHAKAKRAGSPAGPAQAAQAQAQGPGRGRGKGGATSGTQAVPKRGKNASGALTVVAGTAPNLTLTVRTKHLGDVTVLTGPATAFRGHDHRTMTLAGLATLTGRMVNAHGGWNANGELVASQLIVRPVGSGDGED